MHWQAAAKTNDTAGDGTTTATILSAAIIAEGMKIVAAGTNPVQLARGIEATVNELVKELAAMSVDVKDEDLANVATVSAGNNEVVSPCRSNALSELANRDSGCQSMPMHAYMRRDICGPVMCCDHAGIRVPDLLQVYLVPGVQHMQGCTSFLPLCTQEGS